MRITDEHGDYIERDLERARYYGYATQYDEDLAARNRRVEFERAHLDEMDEYGGIW